MENMPSRRHDDTKMKLYSLDDSSYIFLTFDEDGKWKSGTVFRNFRFYEKLEPFSGRIFCQVA